MRVLVVHGGTSTEQSISTQNAAYVTQTLLERGYDAVMLSYEGDVMARLRAERPDIVYLCVQGKGHGDGALQAMLDYLDIPYTGAKTTAAALINDKIICKELFSYTGIRTPKWQTLSKRDYKAARFDFTPTGFPFVAKAPTQGGSFGIELISSPGETGNIESVFEYDDPILIEQFIEGRFATIGLLETPSGLTTLPCVEADAERLGNSGGGLLVFTGAYSVCKACFPEAVLQEMDELSRRAFAVTRARGYARVDFMVSEADGLPYILEINAVPGLKPQSLYPQAAMIAGIEYGDLIEKILLTALTREEDHDAI